MSVLNIPANKNFLSPLGFKFTLMRAPNLDFNIQNVSLPGVDLGDANSPTPFVSIPLAGNIRYSPLSITFRVSEDIKDYLELHDWMVKLGPSENFDQFKSLRQAPLGSAETEYSDITLIIMNSSMQPNIKVVFHDAFPISLGNLDFNTTDSDVNYIQCTADFKFLKYNIELIS